MPGKSYCVGSLKIHMMAQVLLSHRPWAFSTTSLPYLHLHPEMKTWLFLQRTFPKAFVGGHSIRYTYHD